MTNLHSITVSCHAIDKEALLGSLREMVDDIEQGLKEDAVTNNLAFFAAGDFSSSSATYSGPQDFEFLNQEQTDFNQEEFDRTLKEQGLEFSEDEPAQ